ncbi:MAG: aromatic amino acid transport family protein [Candidatus Paceibacterota bacterium]
MFKRFIYPIAVLSGTIIGVGFFSLPYITLKVGIWVMLGYLLVLGGLVALIHYLFGKVAVKTPDFLRLPGYAQLHLGKWGKGAALTSTIMGLLGALLAYLIVGGEFLSGLLSPVFGGSSLLYSILYFVIGFLIIFFGIKIISKIEFWGMALFFVVLAVMFLKGFPYIKIDNLFLKSDISLFFLPYGPILFSLWGASIIPEVEEMLGEKKELLKKIIPVSLLIPILVYILFILLILGITGASTTDSALTGLKDFLGPGLFNLGIVLGLLATFTSFISIGLTLKNIFSFDLKINKHVSLAITCFVPLFLFLIGIKSFISVISFVGGITIGIDGILILLMYNKISQRKFLVLPLVLVLLGGIIYEVIYFIK